MKDFLYLLRGCFVFIFFWGGILVACKTLNINPLFLLFLLVSLFAFGLFGMSLEEIIMDIIKYVKKRGRNE